MKMELLSPAGAWESLIAAVQNGANAVYLGGQMLNARRNAAGFDADGLKRAVDYCHERGVRTYVTVNTMAKQAELPSLQNLIRQIAAAGADAAIVGELGAARTLKKMLPSLPLHASTQLAIHNEYGVQALERLNFERVVLAREMTFEEIAACRDHGVALECFAHGALCTACSGQCLFSSLIGGRSGNRGLCAQPCRLPHTLDGAVKAKGYLLSPRDLCQIGQLDRLRDAGVMSLKIEGRLRRPEYVAVTTKAYRTAIDALEGGEAIDSNALAAELRQVFNRGNFTVGYGPGAVDAELMYDEQPNHLGVVVGHSDGYGVLLDKDVLWADGLVLRRKGIDDRPVKAEGRVGERVLKKEKLNSGDALVRMSDDVQLKAARESMNGEHRHVPIDGHAAFAVGKPAALIVTDRASEIRVEGEIVQPAANRPSDARRVGEQLRKTGGTAYCFDALDVSIEENAFVAVSALNDLRRRALEGLSAARIERLRGCAAEVAAMDGAQTQSMDNAAFAPSIKHAQARGAKTRLTVQSGDFRKLRIAMENGADAVCFAPEDVTRSGLDENLKRADDLRFSLALPMVLSGGDLAALNRWAKSNAERITGVYASNLSHFALDWPGEVRADYPLNAANEHTVDALTALGAATYTPSVELTSAEIAALGGEKELIIYGNLPLMQLRHCPVCVKSGGGKHAACSRCDKASEKARLNEHALIDRKNARFPLVRLKTKTGCIVRVNNSVPLMLLRHIGKLPVAQNWRVLLSDEPDALAAAVVKLHRIALDGGDPKDAAQWNLIEAMPSTTGHYFRGVE